jgi:putative ABC transport system permease protein
LRDPGSIVLTETVARKFFGAEDPLGKVLFIRLAGKNRDFRVSGLAKDAPENSSIRFNYLISMELSKELASPGLLQSWFNVVPETYVELKAGATGKSLEPKLETISRMALGAEYKPGVYTIKAQPLASIRLDKSYPSGLEPISDPAYSYILAGIAILVLLLACLNFVTLSVGRSSTRAREVGVRKAVGADRGQLMKQFWGEAILTTFFSLLAGLGLARLALPTFRVLSGKSLVLDFGPWTLLALFFILAVAGLAAGFYPALVLSSFRPVDVLKGRLRIGRRTGLRRTLVVFQFVLSIALIVSTLIMARQLRYLRTKDLGFRGGQVVVLRTNSPRAEGERLLQTFRGQAVSRPGIVSTAGAAFSFGEGWTRAGFTTDEGIYREFYMNIVSPEFLDTLSIPMAAGRNFSRDFPADATGAILVNETFVREFHLASPVGNALPGKKFPPHSIIGVLKDFHFQSLHDPIRPLVLVLDPSVIQKGIENINTSSPGYIKVLVRIGSDNIPETMSSIRGIWNRIAPGLPFDYSFLDKDLDFQYRREEQWGRIVRYASQFAVLIACLGLFGLTSLVIAQRYKEIGIRKVLGSSAGRVLGLLSWDFLKLVLLSNVLAWPLAYYAMSRWVQDFAYRIKIGPGSFLLAAALGAVVAQATIGVLALKAALADPVEAIRYE